MALSLGNALPRQSEWDRSDRSDIPGVMAKPPTIYSMAVVVALVLHFIMPLPISPAPMRLWIGLGVIGLGGVLEFGTARPLKIPMCPPRCS